MAKKIWAYAKDRNGYIKQISGRTRLFFIWEALRMKSKDTFNYNKHTFLSTQSDEDKRYEMIPVKNGFFRYKSNKGTRVLSGGDGESLSHEISISALFDLEEINFVIKNKSHIFNFSEMRIEDNKIRFENGNVYFPDLIGFFTSESEYFRKWGGKVAIEVKVTHGCEPEKVRDFEDHGIPILEIFISDKIRFLPEKNKVPFNEDDLEDYYKNLIRIFSTQVYAKVLSDPCSIEYQKDRYDDSYKKIDNASKERKTLVNQNTSLIEKIENKTLENQALNHTLDKVNNELGSIKNKLITLNNRTIWQKIINLFQ